MSWIKNYNLKLRYDIVSCSTWSRTQDGSRLKLFETHHLLELFSIVLSWHFFAFELTLFSARNFLIFCNLNLFLDCLLLWMSCYHLWYSLEVTLFYLNDFESGAREQFHALGVTPVNFEGGGSRFKTWRTPFRWLREVTIIHNHQNQGYSFKSISK